MKTGDFEIINGKKYQRKVAFYSVGVTRQNSAGTTVNAQILIDAGIPFICERIHGFDTADGKALTSQEDWSIQAVDNEGGYQWCQGLTSRSAFCGGREHGRSLRGDNLIRANTTITFTITDATTPSAGIAYITLQGWSLFPVQGQ
jgi:hypothetical protein